ncbi:MAG: hypothetical protein OXI01_03395 [Albidovulum sp.]|nr:hypothetical protein [Albidovulum sp.]
MDAAAELAQPGRENEKLRTDNVDPGLQLERLGFDCTDLKRQLDWFRRQLFGSKSEKRVEIPPEQTAFWDRPGLEEPEKPEEPEFEFAERKKKKRGKKNFEGAVNESGLRFGPDVPVETIPLDNPEAEAIPESEREPVGEKTVHRLAQTPSSFRIIRYVLRTWKRRDTGKLAAAASPPAVLDRTCADAGFLAGMMVDKFCRRPSAAPAAPAAGGGGDPRGPLQPRELDAGVGVLAGPDPGRPVPVDPGEQGHRDGRDADPGRADRAGKDAHRPGSGRCSATAAKSTSPSGWTAGTEPSPTCSATSRARCSRTATGPAPPTRNPETARPGTQAAGPAPGASSRRRRIPSRGSPPRRWS